MAGFSALLRRSKLVLVAVITALAVFNVFDGYTLSPANTIRLASDSPFWTSARSRLVETLDLQGASFSDEADRERFLILRENHALHEKSPSDLLQARHPPINASKAGNSQGLVFPNSSDSHRLVEAPPVLGRSSETREDISVSRGKRTLSNTAHMAPNNIRTPDEYISCATNLAQPFLDRLSALRDKYLNGNIPRGDRTDILHANRTILESSIPGFFDTLRGYQQVDTLFFNASISEASKCMLPQYISHFGTSNCSALASDVTRDQLYGQPLYGLKCLDNEETQLLTQTRPFGMGDLAVGLPQDFRHDPDSVTLTYIQIVRQGVVNEYGDVVSGELELVPHRCHSTRKQQPTNISQYDEVFTIAQYYKEELYHLNVDMLTRLMPYVPFLKRHPQIRIHVSGNAVFYPALGLSDLRLISGNVQGRIVYVPAGAGCCIPNKFTTQLTSFYIRRSLPNAWGQRDTIILIKRSPRRYRYFHRHTRIANELQRLATSYGVHFWIFSDDPVPPLPEVAAMFNRALLVVAPHGAGEMNLLFSQPGTALVESLCRNANDQLVNVVFRNIMHVLGGYYYGVYKSSSWHCFYTKVKDLSWPISFLVEHVLKEMGTQHH